MGTSSKRDHESKTKPSRLDTLIRRLNHFKIPAGPSTGNGKANRGVADLKKTISNRSFRNLFTLSSKKNKAPRVPLYDNSYSPAATKLCMSDFELLKVVGTGTFGKVFLAKDLTNGNRPVAIKAFSKEDLERRKQVKHTLAERRIMELALGQPFLAQLLHAFCDARNLFMVSKFCSGGELFFHLREMHRFNEDQVRFFSAQVACALRYLHENSIAYRDLKSENLLLTSTGHLVVTDFGLARENVEELHGATSICGTVAYVAPEMIACSHRRRESYGYMVDWWELGVLIYDMLVGTPPFVSDTQTGTCQRILSGSYRVPTTLPMSYDCRDIISALLQVNPSERLGASGKGGWGSLSQHPFFATFYGSDWNARTLLNMKSPMQVHKTGEGFSVSNFDECFTSLPLTLPGDKRRSKTSLLRPKSSRNTKNASFDKLLHLWEYQCSDVPTVTLVEDASKHTNKDTDHEICAA